MKRILISLTALMLVLSMNAAALAESTATDTALQEAQSAYNTARQSSSLTDYEAELKAMVEAGSLTQEQADLLLTAANETVALCNGVCPSCGYQFQSATTGKNGHGAGRQHGYMNQSPSKNVDTTTDLGAAQAAYNTAKQNSSLTDYEAELKAMVEAGSLTQEQADLLLTAAKESAALANGTCPSCGYQFQTVTSGTKGFGMNNGKGHGGRH